MADLSASVDYLQTLSHVRTDRIGVTGFCFGGGLTWLLSVRNSEIAAAVPFYRSAPPLDEVPNLSAPVLGIYAGDDERINSGVPDPGICVAAKWQDLPGNNIPRNETRFLQRHRQRYRQEAATAAWQEALGWFDEHPSRRRQAILQLLMRERTPKLIPSVITVKIADFHAHTWPRQGNPQFSRKGESSGTGGKEGSRV